MNTTPATDAGTAPARTPGAPAGPGVLTALSLAMLLPAFGTSSAHGALPTLALAFGASFQEVQWVVLAYLLTGTALMVGAGVLGDRCGRRRLLLAGIALFTLASLLAAGAPGLGLLLAARGLQGLGAAIMTTLSLALVGAVVPRERTGRAMGLLGTLSAVGTALGPALGGLLIARFGWPAVFLIQAPLGGVAWVLAVRHLPPDRPRPSGGTTTFDWLGTLLLAAALAAYALAMTLGHGRPGALNLALLLAAALGLAVFVRAGQRTAAPLLPLALLRHPLLGAGCAASALVATVVMATLAVGPFYLTGALGLDAAGVGLVLSLGPLVAALAGIPAGRLVDRLGADAASRLGLTALLLGAGLLALLPTDLGVLGYGAPLALLTAGYALFQAANHTAVLSDVAADRRGAVAGLLSLARNLGLITGSAALGAVFAWAAIPAAGAMAKPADIARGLHATFAVAAALIAGALVIAAGAHRRAARNRPPRSASN